MGIRIIHHFKDPSEECQIQEIIHSIHSIESSMETIVPLTSIMNTGFAVLDFGNFPGFASAMTQITGQKGISADSTVRAWIIPKATIDHSEDEHFVDPPRVLAGKIVPGFGFMIYGFAKTNLSYGKWSVAWEWTA